MQFAKTFGVAASNIFSGRNGASRNVYTSVVRNQRLSSAMQYPRGHHRVTSLENVFPQEEQKAGAVNKDENFTRGHSRNAESELEEIENNLFNNRQQQGNLLVNDILKQYNGKAAKPFAQAEKNARKQKKPSKVQHRDELDIETFNTLKSYQVKEKSIEVYDDKNKLKYTVLKRNDPLFCDLQRLVTSRKKRELEKKLVLEGKRLVIDALEAGLTLDSILFSDLKILDELNLKHKKSIKFYLLRNHMLQEWSDLVTCPGIIAIFNKPQDMANITIRNESTRVLPITLVCDNIREPNNLGSIIRSCAAMPVSRVVLLKGCTHPWDPKCLRGGAGAHFRVNIIGPLELHELTEIIPPNASFLVADNRRAGKDETFPFSPYDAANYRDMEHVVLVVGGETHGISSDVRRFVSEFSRDTSDSRVIIYNIHIPLENGVESLNAASATSVLLCEIRRQLNSIQ